GAGGGGGPRRFAPARPHDPCRGDGRRPRGPRLALRAPGRADRGREHPEQERGGPGPEPRLRRVGVPAGQVDQAPPPGAGPRGHRGRRAAAGRHRRQRGARTDGRARARRGESRCHRAFRGAPPLPRPHEPPPDRHRARAARSRARPAETREGRSGLGTVERTGTVRVASSVAAPIAATGPENSREYAATRTATACPAWRGGSCRSGTRTITRTRERSETTTSGSAVSALASML